MKRGLVLIFALYLFIPERLTWAVSPHIEPRFHESEYLIYDLPVPARDEQSTHEIKRAMKHLNKYSAYLGDMIEDARRQGTMQLDCACYFPEQASHFLKSILYHSRNERMQIFFDAMKKLTRLPENSIRLGRSKTIYRPGVFDPYCELLFFGYEKSLRKYRTAQIAMHLYD